MPLHVRCFSRETYDITSALARLTDPVQRLSCITEKANLRFVPAVAQLPAVDHSLNVTMDLQGLSNSFSASEETSEAFLDLSDSRFRSSEAVIGKWEQLLGLGRDLDCNVCEEPIYVEVRS